MGLDIYAGTLTRYFTRNWKTHVQKMAEIKGYKFCLYHPKVAIKPIEDPAQIREIHHALCQWRDELGSTIQPNLPAPLWDEDTDEEYFYRQTRLVGLQCISFSAGLQIHEARPS